MTSEEDVSYVRGDSSYDDLPIDIIDLTKESPKIRPLRRLRQRNQNLSMLCNTRSFNRNSQRCLSPLTLGNIQDTKIKNSTRKRRMYHDLPSTHDTTVNLDDTNEENNTCYINLSNDKEDNEKASLKCPICFELLCTNLKPTTTRCGHVFCAKCLETHIRVNRKKCPTCQSNVTLKSCTRLYI